MMKVFPDNRPTELLSAKDLAAKVKDQPKAPRFQFDVSSYNGVNMHLIEADVPEKEDEARRVFGETLRVHIGTGEKSVYAAVGKNSEALMKELIDSGSSDNGGSRPVGQLRFKFGPGPRHHTALGGWSDPSTRVTDVGVLAIEWGGGVSVTV